MQKTLVKDSYGVEYQITESGTAYHAETNEVVVAWLETARKNRQRIRVFYGDAETGEDWMEEFDTMGYIGRSTGDIKIPILVHNTRSMGGGATLDHCIVKIMVGHQIAYQHPTYHQPKMTIIDLLEFGKDDGAGLPYQVNTEHDTRARFETYEQADRYIQFLEGKRHRK